MAQTALVNAAIIVNNVAVPIVPNTFKFTEGLGEQKMRVQTTGGGAVESVLSQDVETNLSKVTFDMLPTAANIDLIKSWKVNGNSNAISATDDPTGFARFFGNAALLKDYEVPLGSDTKIEMEFHTDAAV